MNGALFEPDARGVDQTLLWLRTPLFIALRLLPRLAHVDGIAADAFNDAGDDTVIGEVERLQLHAHQLAVADVPDVLVHDIGHRRARF